MDSSVTDISRGFSLSANSLSSDLERLADPSAVRIASKSLFALITYFDNYASFYPILQTIVSYWKFLLVLGSALNAACSSFWIKGTLGYNSINVVSVFFHLIPLNSRDKSRDIFLMVYIASMTLFYVLLMCSAFYYRSNGKLNSYFSTCLNTFLLTFNLILPPIATQFAGEMISMMIVKELDQTSLRLSLVIFSFLITVFHLMFQYVFCSQTIMFRIEPTPVLERHCQSQLTALILIVTLISSIASKLQPTHSAIMLFILSLVYLDGIRLVFFEGSFINLRHSCFFYACIISSAIISIVIGIVLVSNNTGSETFLFCFLMIFIICYMIAYNHLNNRSKNILYFLDNLEENYDNINEITSIAKFANFSIIGFGVSHPSIISWNYFKVGCNQWDNDLRILIIHAKYAAIFPEERNTLQVIGHNIAEQDVQSLQKEQAIHQITSILRTRESNLTIELKQKISKMNSSISKTKHKMRNLWDVILQGNVKELIAGISSAYESVCYCDIETDQLLKQFPNNRFVSRLYSRYLKEVKAEYTLARQWVERTKDLCLSKATSNDTIHEAGMYAFPNVVHAINRMDSVQQSIDNDSETADDGTSTADEEQIFINDVILTLKIQVVQWTHWILAIILIFAVLLPIIFLLSYFFTYIENLAEPLDHMYAISYMRMLNFMLSSFGQRLIMEKIPSADDPTRPMAYPIDYNDSELQAFGYEKTISGQITYLLKESMVISDQIAPIRTFAVGNPKIDAVRSILFTPSTIFKYYPAGTTSQTLRILPAETICITVTQYLSQLIELPEITNDTLSSIMLLTATTNVLNPGMKTSEALALITEYISENDAYDQTFYLNLALIISGVIFLLFIIMIVIMLQKFESNKRDIFGALSALPKTVLSTVSASFSIIEKKQTSNSTVSDPDNDLNKQEEKAIKLFTSISDDSGGVSSIYVIIFSSFLIVVCGIAAIVEICLVYREMSTVLMENAPHIDYLGGAMSYIGGMFNNMGRVIFGCNGYRHYEQSSPGSVNTFNQRIQLYIDYYHKARFGGSGDREFPFIGMIQGLDYATSKSNCSTEKQRMRDTFLCLDSDLQAYFFRTIMRRIMLPYELHGERIPVTGTGYDEMWFLALHLYDTLFDPMLREMGDTIIVDLNTGISPIISISSAMLFLILIFYLVSIVALQKINDQLKFGIGLFRFCPESAIHGSPRIMSLLAGQYGYTQDDMTERNAAFYDTLVNKLSDIVIIAHITDNTITTTNSAFDQMFDKAPGSYVGHNVKEFFNEMQLKGRIDSIFEKNCSSMLTYNKGEEQKYISFSSTTIGEYIFINGRDQTREMMHMQLIQEERSKSDAMLRTIIPISLVSRVQAGENNISFSVQSASICFLDIVSFTPWCGSSSAQYVMQTLNNIFSKLDEAISNHASLMRIKCIGDCYMAAGGIFTEGNHPEVHAREMTEFGLESIKVLEQVNEQIGESLKIRVGINTGGPIVAGVIGTAKPTFEIIGPAINMAQQMEHTGIPMQVHISRAVYELIYGGNFKIKERGEVEVKGRKVSSYIVIPE